MNFILRLKHWQIFPFLILGLYLMNLRIPDNLILTTFLSVTGGLFSILWIQFIARALYRHLPKGMEFNIKLFTVNSTIWFVGQSVFAVLLQIQEQTLKYGQLFLIIVIVMFLPVLYCNMFPARILRSLESNEKADNEDAFWYFLLFLFLPIGIWILQPKINRLTTDRQ